MQFEDRMPYNFNFIAGIKFSGKTEAINIYTGEKP